MALNMLTADQVANRLGVQRATVYAYVSRGLLPRRVGDDGRTSWFEPDDVDRLARRGRPRRRTDRSERAGAVDVVLASGVSQIADDQLRYRGHDVASLLGSGFEATAELLWSGVVPPEPPPPWAAPPDQAAVADAATRILPTSSPMAARLAVAVAAIGAADPTRADLRPETVQAKARTMLTVFARTPPAVGRAPTAARPRRVAAQLWPRLSGQRPTAVRVATLDAALVLLADHELATSTLAARVAASTRANPFACVLAAIGAVSGPLHGRLAVSTHRFLAEAVTGGDPVATVNRALEEQGAMPGFGHPLYRSIDPRAALLLDRVASLASPTTAAVIDRVRQLSSDATGTEPNVDFALGALAVATDMPLGATEGIFAIGRTAGWVAHVLEEYEERPLRYRPRAIYTGPAEPGGQAPTGG